MRFVKNYPQFFCGFFFSHSIIYLACQVVIRLAMWRSCTSKTTVHVTSIHNQYLYIYLKTHKIISTTHQIRFRLADFLLYNI